MQDDTKTFIHLLKKQIDGTLSDDELFMLDMLLDVIPEAEQLALLDKLIDEHLDAVESDVECLSKEEEEKIIQRIIENEDKDPKPRNQRNQWFPYKWFAAAACLLVLGYSTITLWNRNAASREKVVSASLNAPNASINPAGEKAILTTEDGSVIPLDAIKVGEDVLGSNFKIVRMPSGELHYQSLSNVPPDAKHTINTPKGGIVNFVLPDGSKVWLNAASSLTFNLGMENDDRLVEVTGEAYFEVAKRKAQKFIVRSLFGEIEVLGTKFNVNTYVRQQNKIALFEGSIRLKTAKTAMRMTPSQLAVVGANGKTELAQRKDIADVLLWKDGFFNFHDADAYQVADELSRWYNVDAVVMGSNSHHQINGKISRDLELSKMLEMLDYLGLQGRYKNNKLIINIKMKPSM